MLKAYFEGKVLIILLPKTTVAQNEVALSYRRVSGLYYLAVIYAATISLCDVLQDKRTVDKLKNTHIPMLT